jgi:hypothetical protein
LIFGTALGYVRSEFALDRTTAIMSPQIVGAVQDGDTMTGKGYTTDILTDCVCSAGSNASDIMAVSTMDNATSTDLLRLYNNLKIVGIANHITWDGSSTGNVTITTLVSRTSICGGVDNLFIPVCTTTFFNHTAANITATYMTDGTPASIAAKEVHIRDGNVTADMKWVYHSMMNIMNQSPNVHILPSTIPGTMNPLLWWTTPNLLTIDPAFLNAGLETTFAILLRGGTQRTYSVTGSSCIKNIQKEGYSFITMSEYSVIAGVFLLAFQLVVTVISFMLFVPWFLCADPIGPAVRALRENIYFTTLLNSSAVNNGFHELCNAQTHMIWQSLDVVVRIGESIQTVSEEVGHVAMDKPKLIRKLVNGKKYY